MERGIGHVIYRKVANFFTPNLTLEDPSDNPELKQTKYLNFPVLLIEFLATPNSEDLQAQSDDEVKE